MNLLRYKKMKNWIVLNVLRLETDVKISAKLQKAFSPLLIITITNAVTNFNKSLK